MDIRDWLNNRQGAAKSAGQCGEEFAARFLTRRGLTIVARNYADRGGEIDLVARQGELLIFVEVRLRNHRHYASGAESVDARKQRKIIATAALYLQKHYNGRPPPCRFDVLALKRTADASDSYEAEWLQDAFRPDC